MLAEKYFPKGSPKYVSFASYFQKLDGFISLKPERWFGVLTMVLAGSNVAGHINNRWMYWDWSTLSFFLVVVLFMALWWDRFTNKSSIFPEKVNSFKSALYILVSGSSLYFLGIIPYGFDLLLFQYGLPYIIFFLIGYMVWSISIETQDKYVPPKNEIAPTLGVIIVLTILSSFLGYMNDDPMISTIAAVYTPFPIVALIFPSAIRHIQRCQMHVVFIPAMFLSVRFPWFLIVVVLLFWLLRYFHYFRNGEVKPSFKVVLPDEIER